MFSGIIEAVEPVLHFAVGEGALRIQVRRPMTFDDIKNGDSIAVNGACLTVEEFTPETMTFSLGAETLKVLHLDLKRVDQPDFPLRKYPVNLERSLRFGDRMHGHFVTGHVDTLAKLRAIEPAGDSQILRIIVPDQPALSIWKKGSVCLNGVSLTVNEVVRRTDSSADGENLSWLEFEVCLIPETLARTNLSQYEVGETLNVEFDWMAKGLMLALQDRMPAPQMGDSP